MSATETNHFLSLLVPALKKYAGKPIIRPFIPGTPPSWGQVSFSEWDSRLAVARVHWSRALPGLGLQQTDVVGLWLTGKTYTDLLNISGVSAAGYVPQLFSPVFTSQMIRDLLALSGARVLIYDAEDFPHVSENTDLPILPALNQEDLDTLVRDHSIKLEAAHLPQVHERQTAIIFHSSGTTYGVPKLIPTSHLLMRVFIEQKFPDCLLHGPYDPSSNVFNSLGSLAHVGTFQAFHGAAAHGCTTVQASSMAMAPAELLHMVRATGLNRLVQYGTFVGAHVRAAADDAALASILKDLRQVLYTGVALGRDEERLARGLGVRLTAMYGTSETGPLLISSDGSSPLRPCRGAQPVFVAYHATDTSPSPSTSYTDGPSSSAEPAPRQGLYEIVVAPDAPDAPPSTLFSADGWWHTQDVFAPAGPVAAGAPEDGTGGRGWVYKGRAGDWIKTVTGFVDTRAIEDAVRSTCADLAGAALVVGTGRMRPVLLVEALSTRFLASPPFDAPPSACDAEQDAALAAEIVRRLAPLNRTLFPYERIADARQVLVLAPRALLRNREKGNLRREACEEAFRARIDAGDAGECLTGV